MLIAILAMRHSMKLGIRFIHTRPTNPTSYKKVIRAAKSYIPYGEIVIIAIIRFTTASLTGGPIFLSQKSGSSQAVEEKLAEKRFFGLDLFEQAIKYKPASELERQA